MQQRTPIDIQHRIVEFFRHLFAVVVVLVYFIPMLIIGIVALVVIIFVPRFNLTSTKPVVEFIRPVRWAERVWKPQKIKP